MYGRSCCGWPGRTPENDTTTPEGTLWLALCTAPDEGADIAELMRVTGMSRATLYRHLAQHARAGRDPGQPPESRNRPYDNRPRPGQGRAKRRTSPKTNVVRVVLSDEPPRLTPGGATALLRILLKAYDRLAGNDTAQGGAE
jgi:hypothetical protein